MDIDNIIENIEKWMEEDPTHTSAFVICTTKSEADEVPNVHAYIDGMKNDALQALASTAYENPEAEELLRRVMECVRLLHQEDEDLAAQKHTTDGEEANYAS